MGLGAFKVFYALRRYYLDYIYPSKSIGLRTQEFFIQHEMHNEILQTVVCFRKDNKDAS